MCVTEMMMTRGAASRGSSPEKKPPIKKSGAVKKVLPVKKLAPVKKAVESKKKKENDVGPSISSEVSLTQPVTTVRSLEIVPLNLFRRRGAL